MELGFYDYQYKFLISEKFEKKVNEIIKKNVSLLSSTELKKIYYKIDKHTDKCISKIKRYEPSYRIEELEDRIESIETCLYITNTILSFSMFIHFFYF